MWAIGMRSDRNILLLKGIRLNTKELAPRRSWTRRMGIIADFLEGRGSCGLRNRYLGHYILSARSTNKNWAHGKISPFEDPRRPRKSVNNLELFRRTWKLILSLRACRSAMLSTADELEAVEAPIGCSLPSTAFAEAHSPKGPLELLPIPSRPTVMSPTASSRETKGGVNLKHYF